MLRQVVLENVSRIREDCGFTLCRYVNDIEVGISLYEIAKKSNSDRAEMKGLWKTEKERK